jgi:RND family efflux transporter MFP subunit
MWTSRLLAHLLLYPAFAFFVTSGDVDAQKFECLVEPYLEVGVSSAVAGMLDEVLVDRGDVVRRGQVLAKLHSAVEEAHYELVKARAEFAKRQVARNEELYLKQMISSHEKDELETNAHLLQLELRELEEQLKMRTIHSPLDGVVVERLFSAGEFVNDVVVFELAQIDPLRVEVTIPVQLYGQIKVGMTGKIQWEAPLTAVQSATVTVVDPVVDAASGTIGVRLELPNPNHTLPAGTQCWAEFPIRGAQ